MALGAWGISLLRNTVASLCGLLAVHTLLDKRDLVAVQTCAACYTQLLGLILRLFCPPSFYDGIIVWWGSSFAFRFSFYLGGLLLLLSIPKILQRYQLGLGPPLSTQSRFEAIKKKAGSTI